MQSHLLGKEVVSAGPWAAPHPPTRVLIPQRGGQCKLGDSLWDTLLLPEPNPICLREMEWLYYLGLAGMILGSNQKMRQEGSRRPQLSPWSHC